MVNSGSNIRGVWPKLRKLHINITGIAGELPGLVIQGTQQKALRLVLTDGGGIFCVNRRRNSPLNIVLL